MHLKDRNLRAFRLPVSVLCLPCSLVWLPIQLSPFPLPENSGSAGQTASGRMRQFYVVTGTMVTIFGYKKSRSHHLTLWGVSDNSGYLVSRFRIRCSVVISLSCFSCCFYLPKEILQKDCSLGLVILCFDHLCSIIIPEVIKNSWFYLSAAAIVANWYSLQSCSSFILPPSLVNPGSERFWLIFPLSSSHLGLTFIISYSEPIF